MRVRPHAGSFSSTSRLGHLAMLVGLFSPLVVSNGVETPPPASGRPRTLEELLPADVLARALWVSDELEALRFHMGRPRNTRGEITVTGAAPREVFFQARTLFQKANRLSFEITSSRVEEPETPPAHLIRPGHVYRVVDAALRRLLLVKHALGIDTPIVEKERDRSTRPTQVFRAIVRANRQLNALLQQRFTSSDVFEDITLGVNYATRLLSRFPGVERIPPTPALEPGRRPADVYARLHGCLERVRRVAERSGFEMLVLEIGTQDLVGITESDAHDLAALLVSELAYIHALIPDAEPPAATYYPGIKFPSHAYRRAGILEKQLTLLEAVVDTSPGWLKGELGTHGE